MVRVAVDGMGGDFAPHAIVKGVALARAKRIAEVVIVGDEAVIRPLISNHEGIEIVHTPVYVEMGDTPSQLKNVEDLFYEYGDGACQV
jgi:glycerol-3-phosphate acyltransferase PlsX